MKKKDSFDISVVIVTRNRNEELKLCLKSIKSSELKFQLIVIDQSDEEKAKKNLLLVSQIKGAVYRRQLKLGKSRGLNAALKLVTAPVVAFTDDDCVVEKNWLNSIRHRFLVEQNVVGVFGRTLPFHPERHPNKICPCVFDRPDEKLIAKPGKHWEQIGFGNNMAFKVDVFERIGFFNELLGPGVMGGAAEDADLALRCLTAGLRLFYDPNVVVFHNRFLSEEEMKKQKCSYICGEVACYQNLANQGFEFAKKIARENYAKLNSDFLRVFYLVSHLRYRQMSEIEWYSGMVWARIKGFGVANLIRMRRK